jgi:glycosyltransferase involved in cell wall biosynthesis
MTSKPLRLLWLIDSLTVGGAERLVLPFVRCADRRRMDVSVCYMTSIGDNAIEKELVREGVTPLNLGARSLRDVRAFGCLLRFVRERKIDLIHAHLTYAAIWAAALSRRTGARSVATLHVAPPSGWSRAAIRDRLMRAALNRWSHRVVAVSDALRSQYLSGGGIDSERFVTVHNGIDVDRFRADRELSRRHVLDEFAMPPDARVAVTVSVLRPAKGIDVLLRSVAAVVERVPNVYFLVIGDGPLRETWSELAKREGVAGRVRWAGYRSDVDRLLPGCDLFVFPTLADAFPTVLLEAMAAGLAVVASRVGGVPEIVDDGLTGVLVPAGDGQALALAVTRLLLDPSGAGLMGENGRASALRRFSTAAWLERLQHLYDAVLAPAERCA